MVEIIKEKLSQLEETIGLLKDYTRIPKEAFTKDKKVYYGAVYTLVLGIEIICDIGNHILSYYFGRKAESYSDIIRLLAEVEVIPDKLARQTEDMTKFRNLAIHVYAKVDSSQVYDYIAPAIRQLSSYISYFVKFKAGK